MRACILASYYYYAIYASFDSYYYCSIASYYMCYNEQSSMLLASLLARAAFLLALYYIYVLSLKHLLATFISFRMRCLLGWSVRT